MSARSQPDLAPLAAFTAEPIDSACPFKVASARSSTTACRAISPALLNPSSPHCRATDSTSGETPTVSPFEAEAAAVPTPPAEAPVTNEPPASAESS